MEKIYKSAEELIGHTPLIELTKTEEKYGLRARLVMKAESFNPAGSAKDRPAREMIDDAERRGLLKKGATIIEPTSGNTGIGLCAIASVRGYKVIIVMPDTMSEERQTLMKAYGAELVLTPGAQGMAGSIARAEELAKTIEGSFVAGQFVNPANAAAHYKTTGPEIWADTDGRVDMFVVGVGTGGTITGAGRFLKEKNPNIKVIAVEPATSNVLSGGQKGSHGLQGIGAGFVPEVLDTTVYDGVVAVTDKDAYDTAREMGTNEGFLVGISSGAAIYAARELAKKEENRGKMIVVLSTDGGDRYLSTDLYK